MGDRDHFAAAALTGLAATWQGTAAELAIGAYDVADAMLREREKNKPPEPCVWKDGIPVAWWNKTNHDAAPAARAACEDCQPQAAAESGNPVLASNAGCAGSSSSPMAWAVMRGSWYNGAYLARYQAVKQAEELNAVAGRYAWRVVPLYRHPQPTLADEEREAVESAVADCEQACCGEPEKWLMEIWRKRAATLRKMLDRLA